MRSIPVLEQSQVAEARRRTAAVAASVGFDDGDAGRAALVATELATNLLKHAGGGEMLVGAFEDEAGAGVDVLSLDKGPGMADLRASQEDGRSTAGSSGTGLGAIRRQSERFELVSWPGKGTVVLARLRRGRAADPAPAAFSWGGLAVPLEGEEACGDAWCARALGDEGDGFLMLVDGLGHGPMAAAAAHAALGLFDRRDERDPVVLLERLHAALRPTRGAAISLARVDADADTVVFAGVGNVAGVLASPTGGRRMISHNGTVGHVMRRVQAFDHPLPRGGLVVLASDGIATSWSLDGYPGLIEAHPLIVAAVILRDFRRPRDDAAVLVARSRPPA